MPVNDALPRKDMANLLNQVSLNQMSLNQVNAVQLAQRLG
ncbi:MAG: hypothetical protein RLZZ511_1873 [Cyanobacteriota bacterium]